MTSHFLLFSYPSFNDFGNLDVVLFHVHEVAVADYVKIRRLDPIRLATSLFEEIDHAVIIGRVYTGFSCQAQIWYTGDLR